MLTSLHSGPQTVSMYSLDTPQACRILAVEDGLIMLSIISPPVGILLKSGCCNGRLSSLVLLEPQMDAIKDVRQWAR